MLNKYGNEPFSVAVLHGGPGAAGEMALVAKELSTICGIIEPFQTEKSIEGQLQELKGLLEKHAVFPIVLAGFSWGAWLGLIFASRYPELVKKLILIGSGPFEEKYAHNLLETRLNRLNPEESQEITVLQEALSDSKIKNKNILFAKLGSLFSKSEAFDPITNDSKIIDARYDIYEAVWKEAKELRSSGRLLESCKKVKCPVIAIHGEYDSHPAEGVKNPLAKILKEFHFILLKECGHCPWMERRAKEQFYSILKQELE